MNKRIREMAERYTYGDCGHDHSMSMHPIQYYDYTHGVAAGIRLAASLCAVNGQNRMGHLIIELLDEEPSDGGAG